ncbi:MAG TPA: hypothetical protein VGP80_06370 [Gemmatimonadales bacterium]|nr:hypothetical protein [Gemmatimonadales bacterium]
MSTLRNLSAVTLRASHHRRLIQLDAERQVLIRRGAERQEVTAVCGNTARLFRRRRRPGPPPPEVLSGDGAHELIAKLVLDDVLEMETKAGFVSGGAAYPHLFEGAFTVEIKGYTGQLSLAALRYGQRLELQDTTLLSARLYRYNTVPASPRISRWTVPSDSEITTWLAASSRAATWHRPERDSPGAWSAWSRSGHSSGADEPVYKLYVSPLYEDLRDVLPVVVAAAANSPAFAFKLGRPPFGVTRPDKLVLYFRDEAALLQTARGLAVGLAGVRRHGVPFTAAITEDGLLSWGMDPGRHHQTPGLEREESWRWWVTNRLAVALRNGGTQESGVQPWQVALERLRLDGINCETFAPQ